MDTISSDFPIFQRYPRLIYLDNAATTQKPRPVIEALREFYENYNSNIHRGVYSLSEQATDIYERSRERVARFIGADPSQIVFVKNATEGLNLAISNMRSREIVSTIYEHHSTLLPIYRYSKSYRLERDPYRIRSSNIVINHLSNVTGKVIDIQIVRDNNPDAVIVVDGTQYIPHFRMDLKKIDVDFYAFSPHKMLGPTGIGILYIRDPMKYEPLIYGGGTVSNVTERMYRLLDNNSRYEAGTPPIAEAYASSVAMDYLEAHREHLERLDREILKEANRLFDEYRIYPINRDQDVPIFSFYFQRIHSHDVAEILDTAHNIAVRSGYHCAQPLHEHLGIGPTTRASFYIYNSIEHLNRLMEALKNVVRKFT
ncbi:MAG: aminotransferase class V-fold PLP-dependent enzyme [Candidatus Micrarchaeota archaeon]|nr:aminotransferase class V-fold PLP-dependent enzyme [Candidatus Micrarchaeota archaeon]